MSDRTNQIIATLEWMLLRERHSQTPGSEVRAWAVKEAIELLRGKK